MTARTEKLEVRVTPDERKAIEARADEAGMKLSEWLRSAGQRKPAVQTVAVREVEARGGPVVADANTVNVFDGGADVSPGLTAKEWDREVKRGYHRGLTTPQARESVTRQYGPRPKE